MNLQFKLAKHTIYPDKEVIEIFHGTEFVGTITASKENTVRFLSKHKIDVNRIDGPINVVEIEINRK